MGVDQKQYHQSHFVGQINEGRPALYVYALTVMISLGCSFLAGILGIGVAIMRYLPSAKKLGWAAIGYGLYGLVGIAIMAAMSQPGSFSPMWYIYIVAAIPTLIGIATLAICHYYTGKEPLPDRQIPLAMIFYMTAVIGLLITIVSCAGSFDLDP